MIVLSPPLVELVQEPVVQTTPRTPSLLVRLLPILLFELYLSTSLLLFVFVPVEEIRVTNPRDAVVFALLGQVMILFGYVVGVRRPASGYSQKIPLAIVIKGTIVVGTVVFASALIWRTNGEVSLWTALTNPGVAYTARVQTLLERTSVPLFAVVRGFMGPILAMFLPVGVLYRKQLGLRWKLLWCFGLGLLLLGAISTGAAKGLFDVVLTLPWLIGVFWQSGFACFKTDQRRTKILNLAFDVALVVFVTMFAMHYFSVSRQSRYGLEGDNFPSGTANWLQGPQQDVAGATTATQEIPFQLSPAIQYKMFMIVKYWSGGYKGLAECLELPFESCFGVGHSSVLSRYMGELNPNNPRFLFEKSYPARAEAASGYSATVTWHTIYPWLASDLTFPGALLFIGWMGFLLARAWNDSICAENPFAIGFLCQILLLFYYIPCNNVRLAFSEELISFWGLLVLWMLTGTRRATSKNKPVRWDNGPSAGSA